MAPDHLLGWIGAQSTKFHLCAVGGCSWLQAAQEPDITQAELHPSSCWERCASPWSGPVPLELSHTAGLGCRKEQGTEQGQEKWESLAALILDGERLSTHFAPLLCLQGGQDGRPQWVAKEGHICIQHTRTGGKEQPKWFSQHYPKEDAKLGPKTAQSPYKTLITLTWLGKLDFAALQK